MLRKIKVMIAEDIDILREDFCEMINEQEDMEIVGSASCGREIVKLAQDKDVDVILMDIEMEKYHDGIEAAQLILQKKPNVSVAFLTIHEDDTTVFDAFTTGAVDYVIKSSSPSEILKSIRNAYKGQSSICPNIAAKLRNEFSRMKRNEESLLFFVNIISELTPTEKELIKLLLMRKKVAEIAQIRCVEIVTVKSQINLLLKKFKMRRTKEIVALIKKLQLEYLFLQ